MINFLVRRDLSISNVFFGFIVFRLLIDGHYIEAAVGFVAGAVICTLLDEFAARGAA